MNSLGPFFLFLFLLHCTTSTEDVCDSVFCGRIDIRFPFGLKGGNEGRRCRYPGFQLSCDNQSQTILSLPFSGDLLVKGIDYRYQTIQLEDPNHCLLKRFLHNFTLSGSPFSFDDAVYTYPFNLTFLRCDSNITKSYPLPPIPCLSDPTNSNSSSVVVSWSRPFATPLSEEGCHVISSALVPIPNMRMWPSWDDLTSDIQLTWTQPNCGDCVASGRDCGFLSERGLQVGCFSSPHKESPGLPRSAKYGLTIGVGIPGLLCLIGLSCFICGKVRMYAQRWRHPRASIIELPTPISLRPAPFVMGLDGPTIEKYPKTVLGESGRLPKANDNTCPICLSEYEPKETLRAIPECNHYFHAHCIDEWLKMNATCPLCRNSPEPSLTDTPSSSLSLSSSLSSLP